MNTIYLKLSPANKKCTKTFTELAKIEYHRAPIFEYALEYVNHSGSFSRSGKTLYLEEIHDDYLIIKLESETPLKMASKSLAGFTRKLISIDKELGTHAFDDFIYNNTLFKNCEIPAPEKDDITINNLTNTEALKLCVDIFSNDIYASAEEQKFCSNINRAIKDVLVEYKRRRRFLAYANGLMKEVKKND